MMNRSFSSVSLSPVLVRPMSFCLVADVGTLLQDAFESLGDSQLLGRRRGSRERRLEGSSMGFEAAVEEVTRVSSPGKVMAVYIRSVATGGGKLLGRKQTLAIELVESSHSQEKRSELTPRYTLNES
jgi:hypothetical protein